MEDLDTSGKSLPIMSPKLELLMEDLGTLGKSLPRILPKLEDFVQGTVVWRLITVSPKGTISLTLCGGLLAIVKKRRDLLF